MERRIREWRGCYGPEQEVILCRIREPGRMGLSDFTDMADLAIIVTNMPLSAYDKLATISIGEAA
jgi:hypothetical protein